MAIWQILTPGGRVSSKTFTSREAARAYTASHPGYKRLEYQRRLGPEPPPKGQRQRARGHEIGPYKPGQYREKTVFRGGDRLVKVNEMFRFVVNSESPCMWVDFLIGGNARPKTQAVEEELVRRDRFGRVIPETPQAFDEKSGPRHIRGTVPGESRRVDRGYLEQIIVEETTLVGVAARLRPDVTFAPGSYIYGWTLKESEC